MRYLLDPAREHHLEEVSQQLAAEFAGIFSPQTVARCVGESADPLGDVTVTTTCRCWRAASPASG